MPGQAHHYVPQTYLRGFFDPRELARRQRVLWKYLPGQRPMLKGTKKIGQQTDFYDLPELPPDENDIEKMLAEIESNVAPYLAALRKGKLPRNQARVSLALYVALQWTRTPWFRDLAAKSVISLQLAGLQNMLERPGAVEQLVEELQRNTRIAPPDLESLKAYMARVAKGEEAVIQRNKAWSVKVMLEHAEHLGRIFIRMRWKLLEAQPGSIFITSNNPMIIVDPAAAALTPEGFKFSEGTEFYLPISPQFTLLGDRKPGPDLREMITAASVKNFNVGQMTRGEEIYASFCSKELQAQFDAIAKNRPPLHRKLPKEYLKAMIENALKLDGLRICG